MLSVFQKQHARISITISKRSVNQTQKVTFPVDKVKMYLKTNPIFIFLEVVPIHFIGTHIYVCFKKKTFSNINIRGLNFIHTLKRASKQCKSERFTWNQKCQFQKELTY